MLADRARWIFPLDPVDEAIVEQLESKLGHKLPHDYRAFVRKYQGAVPAASDFVIPGADGEIGCVGRFLPIRPEAEHDYLLDVLRVLRPRLPEGVIPIAPSGGGDYLLLDLRQPRPPLLWWRHDAEDADELVYLAPDFEAFFALLYEPDLEAEERDA